MEGLQPWRGAREIIDWTDQGRSLMDDPKYRRKPLSLNTRKRIARGIVRFGGPLAAYYVRLLDLPDDSIAASGVKAEAGPAAFHGSDRNNTALRDMHEPIPTVTTLTGGGCYMVEPVAEPFIQANRRVNAPTSIDEPIPTATTAPGGGSYVVAPVARPFIQANRTGNAPRSIDEPIPPATTAPGGGSCVVTPNAIPFLLGQQSAGAPRQTEDPIPTVSAAGAIALVQPMVVEYYGTGETRSVEEPLSTATTKARHALAQPVVVPIDESVQDEDVAIHACIVPNFGENGDQKPRVHDIDCPVPTVTSRGAGCLALPTLSEIGQEELDEIDPRRLVLINGHPYILDIRYRMLRNSELARAMGFTDDESEYEFVGNIGEVTKQIGNAVPVRTAAALVKAILAPGHQEARPV